MPNPRAALNRAYFIACVRSWWWHLTYGMWKGYRETRSYSYDDNLQRPVRLSSTDRDWRIVKIFWERK